MDTVLITGGTGLIGKELNKALISKGYSVTILTRSVEHNGAENQVNYAKWDPDTQYIDKDAVSKAKYVIHLAGENVGTKKWTETRKKEILESRVNSGKLLITALKQIPNSIKAVISASAIGWYGPDPQIPNPRPFIESLLPAQDFLGNVCNQWESSVMPVNSLGKRLVIFRTGIVLSNKGGAYPEFKKTLTYGMASILGSGRQVVSWIHIDDLVKLYIDAIENEQWQGVYNAVAPEPVSNKQLVLSIARQRNKIYVPVHVPAFLLQLMLGEMSVEVLKSTTVSSWKAEGEGFAFTYPSIETAIRKLEDHH